MIPELVEKLVDDGIAIMVTMSVLIMVIFGIQIPEFLILAYGMIIAHYFKSKSEAQ